MRGILQKETDTVFLFFNNLDIQDLRTPLDEDGLSWVIQHAGTMHRKMSGSEVHDIFTSSEELSEVASAGLINYYGFSLNSFAKYSRRVNVREIFESLVGAADLVDLSLTNIGFIMIVLGFVVAFIAVFLLAFKGRGSAGQTRGGGILLIGPIPIIFGSDKDSVRVLVVLAIVLVVIFLIFMLLPTFLIGR